MGLFSALGQIVAAPITIANTVVKDIKNDNGDMAQLGAICTGGLSSVVRGVGKTVERAADKLDD